MLDQLVDLLTDLRSGELADGPVHPADRPDNDALVDRVTMVDTLMRGERGPKRASDINAIVEARARLSFAPGAGAVLGVTERVHRGPRPVEVGSRVRLSGKFLRNTGQYFKDGYTDDVGTVRKLVPFGDKALATVEWDRTVGHPEELMECVCYGEERPGCAECKGTGRALHRVLSVNLEVCRG